MRHRLIAALAAAASLAATLPSHAQSNRVRRETEWTRLLDRDSGWTGGDGIFSIPLDGVETPGATPNGRTLFVFSDSLIGEVDKNGRRLPGARFVNNCFLVLEGDEPVRANSRFWWQRDADGNPVSALLPDVPDAEPGDFYWLGDGIAINGAVHLFAYHLRPGDGWPTNHGVVQITIPLDDHPPFRRQTQVKTPFYIPAHDDVGNVEFGAGIMPNTVESGAPHPDGYVYVYGVRNDPFVKKLLAARVRPENFTDFDAYRFWNGADWVPGVENAAPITGRVSNELSVTPLADGRYVLVYQQDGIGSKIAARVGESPVGPFGPGRVLYDCPEVNLDPDVYVYNAKAHPHLSEPGELLISYNVNTFDFWDGFWYADLGRPRFISVRLDP